MRATLLSGLLASVSFVCLPALAADLGAPAPQPYGGLTQSSDFFISEVRGGLYGHGFYTPETGSVDFNGEVLFKKPITVANPWLDMAIPRFNLGGTASFVGRTSHFYGGLDWTFELPGPFFFAADFGGSVNDGYTGALKLPHTSRVGCNVMFHEAVSLGVHLTDHISLMATAEHISNAGLCTFNNGITNAGLRLGYTF